MRNKWIVFGIIISLLFSSGIICAAPKEDVTFYHCDALGTPVAMTNMQGNVVWRGNSLPFGEDFSGTGKRNTEIRYTGKPYNPALGLYDLGARYYDPNVGRFTGVDPVMGDASDPQRLNSYAYGLNSPYKYVDPDGQEIALALSVVTVAVASSIVAYELNPAVRAGQAETVKGFVGWAKNSIMNLVGPDAASTSPQPIGEPPGGKGGVKRENIDRPSNYGVESEHDATLIKGAKLDRFGSLDGTYVCPEGTLFEQRSLPADFANKPYNRLEVLKPIDVKTGTIKGYYGQPGGGTQFRLPTPINELIEKGYLRTY